MSGIVGVMTTELRRVFSVWPAFTTMIVAVIIYAVLVVALRAISREDLSLMPKGDKIAKILRL